jgi:hypothetical protein
LLAAASVVVAGCSAEEFAALERENAQLRGRISELEKRAEAAEAELASLKAKQKAPPEPTVIPLAELLGEQLRVAGVELVEKDGGLRWSAGGRSGPLRGEVTLTASDTSGTLLGKTRMKSYGVRVFARVVADDGVILKNIDKQRQVLGISPQHALKAATRRDPELIDGVAADIAAAVK